MQIFDDVEDGCHLLSLHVCTCNKYIERERDRERERESKYACQPK